MPLYGMPATAPLAARPTSPATAPRTTARVTLHTVGECRIVVTRDDSATTLTPASDRLFTLALLLATEPGRPLSRAQLAAWLWPDLPASPARHALRQLAYRLRQLGVTVDGDADHLTLAPQSVAPPATTRADGTPRGGRCLPEWHPPGDALAAWVDRYRALIDGATRAALARALEDAHKANRDAFTLAAALLELDPRHPLARATLPRPAAVRERFSAPPLPCIGRDEVLRALHARATVARDGHGSTVVLAAAPSAGVTRLITELTITARELGVTAAPPSDPAAPTVAHALATTVRTLLDRPGALGCPPDTLRVLRRFVVAPALPTGNATVRRLGAAIADLARAVAAERPLLLAVDAPCRAEPERALAAAIARGTHGAAVLTVLHTPLDFAPHHTAAPLGSLGAVADVIRIPALGTADATRLAAAAARAQGMTLSPDDLAWCTAMARGRPGDVIALARACAVHPGTRTLPPAIATRLRADVAALPHRTRQVAAFQLLLVDLATADTIAHTLGRRTAAVHAALAELRRANLPGPLGADSPPPASASATDDIARVVGAILLDTFDAAERTTLSAHAARARPPASPARATHRLVASRMASTAAVSAPPSRTSALPVSSVAPRPCRATTPTSTNSRPKAVTRALPSSANDDAATSPRASASSAARAATSSGCTRSVPGDSASPSTNTSDSLVKAPPRRRITRHDTPPRADRRASTSSK